jgi:AmmeMemoRadiSam system protein A
MLSLKKTNVRSVVRKLQEFSKKEMDFLLAFARKTILTKKVSIPENVPEKFKKKGACFVSLHEQNGELRGCIGSLESHEPLIRNIARNAINAAFNDPRFDSVEPGEMRNIKIEISILTKPEQLKYSDADDLLKKLKAPDDGVILTKCGRSATFLPVVWEHFKKGNDYDKIRFLSDLSLKAGLDSDDWKEGCKIEIYHAILMEEK